MIDYLDTLRQQQAQTEHAAPAHATPDADRVLSRAGWRAIDAGWVREPAPIHAAAWYGLAEELLVDGWRETGGAWETGD